MNALDKDSSVEAVQTAFRQAEMLEEHGQYAQAVSIYQQIIKAKPRWPFGYYGLGSAYQNLGKFEDARRNLRKAIQIKDDHPAFHAKYAAILSRIDDAENAIVSIDRAIELDPQNTEFLVEKAMIIRFNGDPKAAHALLHNAIQDGNKTDQLVRVYASLCAVLGDPEKGIATLEPLTHTVNTDPVVTATHMFVLAKLYDQTGQYDLAYQAATRGSQLRGDTYLPDDRVAQLEQRTTAWSKQRLASMARSRVNSEKPVFIVGMPRSGTTLIEQVIASHPQAYGCGELIGVLSTAAEIATPAPDTDLATLIAGFQPATLDRAARRVLKAMEQQVPKGEKPKRLTDKMPLNFQHLGLIEVLFPNARIIHCQRHVLDNFISCYLLDFAGINNHAYSYDPVHFAHFYSVYLKYMEHWKSVCSIPILDVSYEETIADQRAMTERTLAFLDLEWDDACMSFFETKRAVNTASVEQVRNPIYASSMARWKNFESHLEPVTNALREHGVEIEK